MPEGSARNHPLYGVYAWALLLLAFLVLGPFILVYQDIRILVGQSLRPNEFWIVLLADLVFLAAAWKAAGRLGREGADFATYFYVAAVVGLCAAALFFAILVEAGPREMDELALRGLLWRAVPILAWTVYVLRSRRINVTTRKRVPSDDPFLRAQWFSSERADQPRAARVVRHPLVPRRAQHENVEAGRRGAVREPTRRSRRRAVAAEEQSEETVVVHRTPAHRRVPVSRAATPRSDNAESAEVVESYAPRRPVRSIAGALEPYQPRRAVAERERDTWEETLPAAPEIAQPDPQRLKKLQETEILDRLRQLQLAREEGLVTAAEERAKRQELLREL